MNTSNTSIKAIIFTVIFFMFIILISLFKGINVYDIHFKNIRIKHLFIKIDNKIVLKIDNLKINNSKNYSKQVFNLHKTILLAVKYLNIFENITLNSVTYGKIKINTVKLKNNTVYFSSEFLKFKAAINPKLKNSFINFEYLDIPKYAKLRNLLLNLKFKHTSITANGEGYCNKNKFTAYLKLNNKNMLTINLFSPKFKYRYEKYNLKFNNISLNSLIDLNTDSFNANIRSDFINAEDGNISVSVNGFFSALTPSDINVKTKSLYIPQIKDVQNIYVSNPKVFYDYRHGFGHSNINMLILNYKDIDFLAQGINSTFKNPENFTLQVDKTTLKKDSYTFSFTNSFFMRFYGYSYYKINRGNITSETVDLNTSEIIGSFLKAFIQNVKGKIYGFNSEINGINVDIKKRSADIKKAEMNNVKAENIKYRNNKITFNSHQIFNNDIKKIFEKFLKIQIPVTQTAGYNDINGSVYFGNKTTTDINVTTRLSVIDLFKFRLIVPKGKINITEQSLSFSVDKSMFYLVPPLKIAFKGDGLIDYRKSFMKLEGIMDFKIENLINLENYKEKVKIDFKQNTLKAENSSVYVDFNNRQLIISDLKKILKYTTLKDLVSNGLILINFSKYTDILSYIKLKLPVLFRHSDKPIKEAKQKSSNEIKKIFLNIIFANGNINIFNKYINAVIDDNNISVKINNIDIDLYPLEKLLNDQNGSSSPSRLNISLLTNNSNIIYKTHKFLSQNASIKYKNGDISFKSEYKKSSIEGYTKNRYFLLEGKNFTKDEFNAFLPKFSIFSSIDLDFVMVKSPDEFYTGKIYINKAVTKELKTLNNIIAFINTVPSLLSLSSPGFSAKGYKIENGYINYLYYKKILYIKTAKIPGENIDFYIKGYIDFNKNYMFLKIKANLKMKIKKIPIIGKGLSYLLFGKDGSIDIKMIAKGDIDNPKVEKDIGKEILISPFKLFKRAITLPFNLF